MSGNMSAALAAALLASIVLAACGVGGAPGQPAQIQATPAVHRTTLPSGSTAVPDYGY